MGVTRQKRNRMESFSNIRPTVLYSLGIDDINFEIYDEQQLYDEVNKRLDKQQAKIDLKL